MLLLLHALIPCLGAYILPSSPECIAAYIYCTCFSTFWHCHPYILQHFNGNVLLSCFTGFSLYKNSRMPYYMSIKAYNSTVKEFCAVQFRVSAI